MSIARVVKTMDDIPFTDRFDGVCLAFPNEEKRNCYLVVRVNLNGVYKYKVAPLFNKYSRINTDRFYTKEEILDNFEVLSATKPHDVHSILIKFFTEELNNEID